MFLGWYDDTRKKDPREKIEEAVERYIAKFGAQPDLCLVNPADLTQYDGVEVKAVGYIRPNHFWVGQADKAESIAA